MNWAPTSHVGGKTPFIPDSQFSISLYGESKSYVLEIIFGGFL